MSLVDLAQTYIDAGLSCIPIRPDGSKAPDLPAWKEFQTRLPALSEFTHYRPDDGIAIICGPISGNLEVIDFDDAASFTAWGSLVDDQFGPEFFSRLVIVRTPRPGFHCYIRSPRVDGNLKLAQIRVGVGVKTLIESRGEGGYVLAPGSPGACHETGREYAVIQGSLAAIPVLSLQERDALFACARSFNEVWKQEHEVRREEQAAAETAPGSDFNHRASWPEILQPHGFKTAGKRGDVQLWTRPGKSAGVSASTNFGGSDLFYSFSTNCYPFDSERGYSKFAVYSYLNHNGDFRQAARELARIGYGQPRTPPTATTPDLESEIVSVDALRDRLMSLYVNGLERGLPLTGWPRVSEHWTLRKGEWTLVTGIPSHGKSSYVDNVMLKCAIHHNWTWAVFSAENLPQELHIVNLLEQYIGKPFHQGMTARMSEAEIEEGLEFINAHFRFLNPPEEEETLPRLLALVEAGPLPDGMVIDPWNELLHDYGVGTETDYIAKQLRLFGRFVKRLNIHGIIVAHPAKMRKESPGAQGYPVPTPYDIAGSANWRNKADNALCVWRDETEPGTAQLFIQKIRRRFVGKIGSVPLSYDVVTGRYYERG